jgi:hypothetical protein
MAVNVIAAIRHANAPLLRGNVKFTALEIAHRLNKSGYGHVSYQMMAWKTGYSRRTAINHMHKLVAMGIFAKTVYKLRDGYAINLYRCLLQIPAFYRTSPHTQAGESSARTLPTPRGEEAKELSLRDEIAQLRKGMRLWSQGSDQFNACQEKIAALQALQRPG